MKLCLGTVQFGLDYGIKGQKKPSMEDAVKILDFATQNGIDNIDTAFAYGTAEDVVGEFLKRKTIARDKLFISSKFKPNDLDEVRPSDYKNVIREHLEKQLIRLNTDYLDSYMFHSSRYAFDEAKLEAMYEIKKEGKVRHCGVSVYYPDEAKICIESRFVDFMQLPSSIFDQRMKNEGVFDLALKNGSTQIHSRSAFIQGLIVMNENEVPPFLEKAKPIIGKIDKLCKKYDISRIKLAMLFVKQFKAISHLVFGVDNIEQLKEDIKIFEQDLDVAILREIAQEFENIDADVFMPSLWVKK
ncbi:MAG: aldo/keto reductase [Alphaproteobacteria bacterium]|nr:aldo/keto reductase [Alphaproteobacteria bacterium]